MIFKVTAEDGTSMHGGTGKWTPGRWRSVRGPLAPCVHGLHLCAEKDLVNWLGPVIWEAEYEGEVIDDGDKLVVRKARVIRRVDTWNERTARLFAADCAEHVLPFFEKSHPNDKRPRQAIEVARRFANGEATREELAAVRVAARAVRAAARAAAWDAAWDAARAAAGDAARAAAGDAARAAARAAAWDAAWDAARDAARDAAGDAARAAAWDAAGDAETKWQSARLMEYLRP